jgi:hypothetical protein
VRSFDPHWFTKRVDELLKVYPEGLSRFEAARLLYPSPADDKMQHIAAGWMQSLFLDTSKYHASDDKPKRYRLK